MLFRSVSIPVALLLTLAAAHSQATTFSCASGKPPAHAIALTSASHYTPTAAGFDLTTAPATFESHACSSESPFFLSFPATDGDYKVTVVLGGDHASITTLRAESRRLLLLEQKVDAGKSSTFTFVLNVRIPEIAATGTQVKLKPREIGALDWDPKLTLEFNGEHPALRSVTIEPVKTIPTVYLAGDSTVVDQDKEPWAAWGQMLPLFFGPGVSIANDAESGETIKSFVGERRYDKIMSTIKPGDYLLVQFAHNDQKPGAVTLPEYKDLLRRYIADARAHGATPILVTSMNRRSFDASGHINQTLGEYPQATRDIAAEQHVALLDLNAMSKILFEAMGPDGTLKAFVHYPANTFPGQAAELKDDTHFNAYGAYELARAIVQSIRDQKLPLAPYLRPGIPAFDPAKPDPLAAWHLPPSPRHRHHNPIRALMG